MKYFCEFRRLLLRCLLITVVLFCVTVIDVPILGVERTWETGAWSPLGGTVKNPINEEDTVPIKLGELVTDVDSGTVKHCVGVRYNKEDDVTEPTTSPGTVGSRKKKRISPENVSSTGFIIYNYF